jgi:hypothetical protein
MPAFIINRHKWELPVRGGASIINFRGISSKMGWSISAEFNCSSLNRILIFHHRGAWANMPSIDDNRASEKCVKPPRYANALYQQISK